MQLCFEFHIEHKNRNANGSIKDRDLKKRLRENFNQANPV